MKKYLLLALIACSTSCSACYMPDYDVGDDLHVGDYIDLDEGFDYQSDLDW